MKRCRTLLNSMRREAAHRIRFFSDEKIFSVDEKANRRNTRWLAMSPGDMPPVMKTKHPASVHVFSVISSEEDVMPPYFFKPKERINREVNLETIKTVVKPWMDAVSVCILTCSNRTALRSRQASWCNVGSPRTSPSSGQRQTSRPAART